MNAAWSFQGSAFHTAIETWEYGYRSGDTADVVNNALTIYDSLVSEGLREYPDEKDWLWPRNMKFQTDLDNRRVKLESQVTGFMNWAFDSGCQPWETPDGKLAIEVPFSVMFDGVLIEGHIDRVDEYPDGKLMVRDLKTGNSTPTSFQLITYGYALEDTFGLKLSWGDYYMAKTGTTTAPIPIREIPRATINKWYGSMDRAVRCGIFLPNPGKDNSNCFACDVKQHCSLMSNNHSLED